MTMWDACGYGKQSKRIITRKLGLGQRHRRLQPWRRPSGKASSEHQTMFSQCAAALTGDPNGAAGMPRRPSAICMCRNTRRRMSCP